MVALKLLDRAGIRPPEKETEFLVASDVDAKCNAAGLNLEERMRVKLHLRNARCLRPGGPVDQRRP
jgi:hypothetical protein